MIPLTLAEVRELAPGRLEGERKRKRMAFLPGDQMRDQLAHRATVGDEIVIDEIDRGRKPASAQLVEFCDDLLGQFVRMARTGRL